MNKQLIIRSVPDGTEIAFLEEKNLVEFTRETGNKSYQVGDLYLGRVKKLSPGLNAAFIDVGYERDAFLHYLDLGPNFASLAKFVEDKITTKKNYTLSKMHILPEINKDGKITEVLAKNQLILVQVVKEPISTKGPRLSTELSFPGRYMVLVPFSNSISISKKINSNEEKKRLKSIVQKIKLKNYGVIIRTAAENQSVEEIETDLLELIAKFENAITKLNATNSSKRVLKEQDRTKNILRDLLNDSFNEIATDSPEIFQEIRDYVIKISPDLEQIVTLYKSSKKDLFDHYGIDHQIKSLFGKTVTMQGGAYIIIEHTEAMHVVDVNSGNRSRKEDDQETNALNNNLEAAKEIARQLRLRDLGGIVVIDFIDMHKAANKKLVFETFKSVMDKDRAKHTIQPLSKFCLMEITRQRVRPEINITTSEDCPTCLGTGIVRPIILIIDDIESNLDYIFNEQNEKNVTMVAHPFITSYLTNGVYSLRMKWMVKYKRKIVLKTDNNLKLNEFTFLNSDGDQINI